MLCVHYWLIQTCCIFACQKLLASIKTCYTNSTVPFLETHNEWNNPRKITRAHTHTCLTALCPGLPRWAGTRKVKPVCILLKQETVSGSGISWAICKSAPFPRQITMPAPHHSVFYRPDALPATQPTASLQCFHAWNTYVLSKCSRLMTFTSTGVMARPQTAHLGANSLRLHIRQAQHTLHSSH